MNKRLVLCLLAWPALHALAVSSPHQFAGWTDFSSFSRSTNSDGSCELLSPVKAVSVWNELVPTWNAPVASNGWLRVEVRALAGTNATKFFSFGDWSRDGRLHRRASVKGQGDAGGDVDTDTLLLKQPADAFQFRLTFNSAAAADSLRWLGAVLTDSRVPLTERDPLKGAWGRTLRVPQLLQGSYAGGKAWCSPTTVTMLLHFWNQMQNREELGRDVPEVAAGIHDETWNGTGNWSFNMAYAGSLPGMRGTVTRFNDVRELETWIAAGVPVGVSVCYDKLRGTGPGPNGHLMVCVGFSVTGEIILNDPGNRADAQKAWSRERFLAGWSHSRHTVYLVHPVNAALPADEFGHWSATP